MMDDYGVTRVRAVATSAVREAANADVFLDRIRVPDRASTFEIINGSEESRLVYLAVRDSLAGHAGAARRVDAAGRSRRRQHRPDACSTGSPCRPASTRSARSACGSGSSALARLARAAHPAAQARTSRTSIGEIRRRDPAR